MKRISIWTFVIFGLTTLVTSQLEGASDGIDKFGFPFTFYDSFGGKCEDCYKNFGLKPVNLLIDLVITTFTVALITWAVKKIKKDK